MLAPGRACSATLDVAVIFTLLIAVLLSQVVAPTPCDSRCERGAAEQLLERGELRPAVERLRAAVARYPDEPALTLLLARAYLLDGNLFWAERTLAARRSPADRTTCRSEPGSPPFTCVRGTRSWPART